MKIIVFDNDGISVDRYVVFINKYCFHMSTYPDRANEVNMHGGEFQSSIENIIKLMQHIGFVKMTKIPKSIKYAIRQRCKEIRNDDNEIETN